MLELGRPNYVRIDPCNNALTTMAARLIGMKGQLGVMAPGALADLLVVDGDPLADVALLASPSRSVRAIMARRHLHWNDL